MFGKNGNGYFDQQRTVHCEERNDRPRPERTCKRSLTKSAIRS